MNLNMMLTNMLCDAALNPMTGDKPVILIVVICAVALVAMIALFLTRKKK